MVPRLFAGRAVIILSSPRIFSTPRAFLNPGFKNGGDYGPIRDNDRQAAHRKR